MENIKNNKEIMLTTTDNPYDPFKEFEEWLRCDRNLGYNTLEWIASVVQTKEKNIDELIESENNIEESLWNQAIKEINRLNPRGNFKIVYKN